MRPEYAPIPISEIPVNEERIREVLAVALQAREEKEGIFANPPPEEKFISLIKEQGIRLGDDSFALNALLLVTTLVRGQETEQLFQKISDSTLLEKYAWIFQPSEVVSRFEAGEDIEATCREYLRPAGYAGQAIKKWVHNCRVLQEKYGGGVRGFLEANGNDAQRAVDSLVVFPRAHKKKDLRGLGVKLARLFVQWVGQYNLYNLAHIDQIGLPVDFQVGRVLIQTKGLPLEAPLQAHTATYKILLPLLKKICEEQKWTPQEVSEALWFIGNRGCNKNRHHLCPVEEMCESLIDRKPYDKEGVFDPTDVGRFKK